MATGRLDVVHGRTAVLCGRGASFSSSFFLFLALSAPVYPTTRPRVIHIPSTNLFFFFFSLYHFSSFLPCYAIFLFRLPLARTRIPTDLFVTSNDGFMVHGGRETHPTMFCHRYDRPQVHRVHRRTMYHVTRHDHNVEGACVWESEH